MTINYDELNENHQIIDIREDYELEDFSLEESLHVPMGDLLAHLENFDKNALFVLMCQSGKRSGNMTKVLRAKGHNNFYSLNGGVNHVKEVHGN